MTRFFCIFLCLWAGLFCGPVSAATYYIDYSSGNDANPGTTKESPWKHHPDMKGWTGGSFTAQPGDRFILKGGVTWPNAALSLYITDNGTVENPIYIGIDTTWYTGNQYISWTDGRGATRQSFTWPILDAQGQQIVDSRNILGASQGTRNNIICVKGDNIEIEGIWAKGVYIDDNPSGGYPSPDAGNDHTLWLYTAHNFIGRGLYLSDWVVATIYSGDVGGPIDAGKSNTNPPTASVNDQLIDCRIWGPTNIDPQYISVPGGQHFGNGAQNFSYAEGCDFRYLLQGIWSVNIVDRCNVWDGGAPTGIDAVNGDAAHGNAVNMYGTKILRNSVIHDIAGGTTIYPVPGWGSTGNGLVEVYNNIVWDSGPQPVTVSGTGISSGDEARVFNNIFVRNGNSMRTGEGGAGMTWRFYNNLTIGDGSGSSISNDSVGGTIFEANNITISASAAAAAGMTEANLYKPTSELAALFNQGTNLSTYFTTDLDGTARPQGSAWDIGAYELSVSGGSVPDAPTSATFTALSTRSGTAAWTDNSTDEFGFSIDLSTSATFASDVTTASAAADATSYVFSGLLPNTTYYVRVRSYNGAGNSSYTATGSGATNDVSVEPAPVSLQQILNLGRR